MSEEFPFDIVDQLLKYDALTGDLIWRVRDIKWCASTRYQDLWNKRFAGKFAGCVNRNPPTHMSIRLLGRQHLCHRIAWLLAKGDWPTCAIDHIDGNPCNNRMDNLREVSSRDNHRNTCIHKHNKSGITGVHFSKRWKRWRAQIGINGRSIYLGDFDDFQDAVSARKEAEAKFGFHPNHGRPRRLGSGGCVL